MKLSELPFYLQIQQYINQQVNLQLQKELDRLYQQSPTFEEKLIISQHRYPITINLRPHLIKKNRTKNSFQSGNQCMARIATKHQCSRSRNGTQEYCKGHLNSLPYGRIDECYVPKKKKNSRPAKVLSKEHFYHYILAQHIKVDNDNYIIDENGVIYTLDGENINIVGRQLDDEFILYG